MPRSLPRSNSLLHPKQQPSNQATSSKLNLNLNTINIVAVVIQQQQQQQQS